MGIAIFALQYYNIFAFCFREENAQHGAFFFLVHNEFRSQSVWYLVRYSVVGVGEAGDILFIMFFRRQDAGLYKILMNFRFYCVI